MKMQRCWVAVAIASILIAPAYTAEDEDEGATADADGSAAVCVFTRNISNFDALDNEHVFVQARRDENYLFTLDRGCFGLRSANVIAISDTTSRVCSNSLGRLTYREMGSGLRYCRIRNIEAVADKDAARALVKARGEERQKNEQD